MKNPISNIFTDIHMDFRLPDFPT